MTTAYGGPTDLVEAFVNDNITEGWTIHKEMNIIVRGNTLYVYEKSSEPTTKFVQIAIRIPDNVFILNRFRTGRGTITNLTESTIVRSASGKYIYMRLNPVLYKTDNGDVDPATLRETISNLNQPSAYKIRNALKTFGKERMQEEAIENFRQLKISTEIINNPNKEDYRDLAITAALKEIKRAKKVCRMVDKYLDVLKQFPEPKP